MSDTPADPLVMIAEMNVKPEKLAAFLDYTTANLAVSRACPGNIVFDMLTDRARPTTVLFYEVWRSAEAQQEYIAWRVAAGDLTTLRSFLVEEPTFRAFGRIAA